MRSRHRLFTSGSEDAVMAMTQLAKLDLRPGDEVVLPSFGGEEAADAVAAAGGVPVFADIDPASFCLSPAAAESALTSRTVGVLALHLFGHPADMVSLEELCQRRSVRLVESERPLSSVYSPDVVLRRRNAEYLASRLRGVFPPSVRPGADHTFERFVVRVPGNGRPDRDAFRNALRSRGVDCSVPVGTPAHRLPAHRAAGARLPETDRAAAECLALSLQPAMSRRELNRVASACNRLGGLLCEPAC
ncbi:DegT/DnrJ/EryC1/StrS family aminotransferase [Streptomyces alkaliterrae]|uniref:DegT/DnrJ/EryC1/StrS family aminotransferase n=1 Tax=Streptomyces alkaliterrae TaxID=2213162 RepID=UPI001E39B850|nr:DegT/DnrJ/EryC1/StrS family aminotransferase [Streptomyces alkaliterrae]